MWLILLKKSIPAFDLSLNTSKRLKFIVVVSFMLAIISFWFSGLNALIQGTLTVLLMCFVGPTYRSIISYRGIRKIYCLADGCWELVDIQDESTIYTLKNSSAILGSFFFLHFQNKRKKLNLVLAADSLSAEESRKLRLTMKIYSQQLMSAKV